MDPSHSRDRAWTQVEVGGGGTDREKQRTRSPDLHHRHLGGDTGQGWKLGSPSVCPLGTSCPMVFIVFLFSELWYLLFNRRPSAVAHITQGKLEAGLEGGNQPRSSSPLGFPQEGHSPPHRGGCSGSLSSARQSPQHQVRPRGRPGLCGGARCGDRAAFEWTLTQGDWWTHISPSWCIHQATGSSLRLSLYFVLSMCR